MAFKRINIPENQRANYCSLRNENYASITGFELRNHQTLIRQIHWLCERRNHDYVFLLLDGVTGYESWYLRDLIQILEEATDSTVFVANLGSSSYPRLELVRSEMKIAIVNLDFQLNLN